MTPRRGSAATAARLRRREEAIAKFGIFAFREARLDVILEEAARACAASLGVRFSKICRYQANSEDLRVVAGCGWNEGVVGFAISVADASSPQGRAFTTGEPQVCADIEKTNTYRLPPFYLEHGICSTVDVIVAAKDGVPFGVLEVDSEEANAFDEHDINFLTGFANILAEAVYTASRAEEMRQTLARMAKLVEEKEILSQELKHRVRNSLHLVYGLLNAEMDNGPHSEVSLTAFRAIALRVIGLAQVFDHLLGNGMSDTINLGDYITALCGKFPELYGHSSIALTGSADDMLVSLESATAIGIIVTELVSNAYQHAFPGDMASQSVQEVNVVLRVGSEEAAVLTVSDNGIGCEQRETGRRGMKLVQRLVKQIGGNLSLRSEQGSTWKLELGAASRFNILPVLPFSRKRDIVVKLNQTSMP